MDNIWDISSIHLLVSETLTMAALSKVLLSPALPAALKISSENVFGGGQLT